MMISPEQSPSIPPEPHETADTAANANLLRSQAEFLLSLSDLIEEVHATNPPERTDCEFEFFADLLPGKLELPENITSYCGNELDSLYLSLSSVKDSSHNSSLELRFRDRTLYISRDWDNPDPSAPDAVLRDDQEEPSIIERIPRRDINDLVLQLLTGQRVGTREELERIDVFSPASCAVLLDTLPDIAHDKLTSEQHQLISGRSLAWVTESGGAEERLLTCRFAYETAVPGRLIAAVVDLQHGLKVEMMTQENGDVTAYIPDEGDMLHMQEIVAELSEYYRPRDVSTDPVELETMAPDHLPEIDF